MLQMSILSVLIVVLGMMLVVLPLCNRLGLSKSVGIVIIGIVLSFLGMHELPNLAPALESQDALVSQEHLNNLFLITGAVFCFGLGLHIHPVSLFHAKQQGFVWPSIQYVVGILAVLLVFAIMGMMPWLNLIAVASVCALGSIVLFSAQYREIKEAPSSLQTQYRERYWLNPSLNVQGLAFLVLFMLLPILAEPHQPTQHVAHVMALIMFVTGGLLLIRHIITPLCEFFQKQQPSLVWVCLTVFVLSLICLGQALGLHLLITAFLCGVVLTESRYNKVLLDALQSIHPIILMGLWLALCLMVDWTLFSTIAPWLLAGIVSIFILKWLIGFSITRWQTGQWQEATTRAFQQLTLSELAALLIVFASPSLFTYDIRLNESAETISLQQYLLMAVVVSVLLHAILQLLHTHVIDPLFHHVKFKTDASTSAPTQPTLSTPPVIVIGFGRVGQIITRILHVHQQSVYVLDNSDIDLNSLALNDVYFIQGDATQPDTLNELPLVAHSRVILCIDDIEDSLTTARYLHLHHPDIQLIVRARDRSHAHILKHMGIQHVWRETYSTALDMADHVLHELGLTEQSIAADRTTFMQHDEQLFHMQQLSGITMSYTSTQYNEPLAELKWLFEADAARLQVKPFIKESHSSDEEPPSAAS